MSKSLRLSEKWFNRGLWLIAIIFAGFLTGLGGVVVNDLPHVERHIKSDDFLDKSAAAPLQATIDAASGGESRANDALAQSALKLTAAQQAYNSAKGTFDNWVETRKASGLPSQDGEVLARTKALDQLQTAVASAQTLVDKQRKIVLDAQQNQAQAQAKLNVLETQAQARFDAENDRSDLRVFLYRLALTLPLLALAGWLFVKQRKSTWWPFVWGFIFFALYAFFVELVPYLPSYGGYVRHGVGIVITLLVGRYAIVSLGRYLANQKLAEQLPEKVRREELSYDTALARLSKSVCPGCERPTDLKNVENDFCQHCGISLFDRCGACSARKSAFVHFCHACGLPAGTKAPAAA